MNNHKMVFAVGLLAIAAVLYSGYFAWLAKQSTVPGSQTNKTVDSTTGEEAQAPLPAATGDIDDLSSGIETDLNNQKALLDSLETEADTVTSDSAAIEGFGQVYNENDY